MEAQNLFLFLFPAHVAHILDMGRGFEPVRPLSPLDPAKLAHLVLVRDSYELCLFLPVGGHLFLKFLGDTSVTAEAP